MFAVPVAAWLIPSLSHLAESDSFQRLWGGQAWLWLYLHNFVQAAGPSQLPGMGHLWSLAVEEQFYLVWPLLIWLVPRDRLGLCIGMLLVVGAVLRFVVSCWGYSPWSIMHVTFFRLDGLLVGSAVALFECDPRTNEVFRRWRIATFWCATLTVLSVILWRGTFEWIEPDVQRFGFLSFSVMSGCVVHWLSERDRKLGEDRTQRLGSRILQAWGMYSYAIYVLHMPVIHAMKKVCSPLPDGIAVVSVVVSSASVSFLLAYLTWHFFEKHWLKLKPAY